MTKSFIERYIENLEQEAPKKKKGKILVRFADQIGTSFNGAEGGVTPGMAASHKKAITEVNPLVKSVFENMGRPAPQTDVAEPTNLMKSVLNVLNGGRADSIERLAFETNPHVNNTYQSLYRRKLRLLPDELLKRIAIQDDLVAAIVNTRSQMLQAFGRPQPDRFSTGFKIEAEPGFAEKLDAQGKKDLQDQIERAESILLTCGQTRGWKDYEDLNFGAFMFQQARNAVIFGRCATEIIHVQNAAGDKVFHSFRPMDAGTIYRAAPLKTAAQQVRDSALKILSQIKNKRLKPETFINDEYVWVQVIEGRPVQAFTSEECIVHNFYPITDIELDGYPLTPLDTVLSAVTTHINITTHNKLYFQSGRAARGMLVFKSDDVDDRIIDPIRQQFQANVNGVGNAWRMPIFGIGTDDEVTWSPIDNSSRDMEFQYLSDTNARVILSAFQMSPEELPGYAHLSRGTNNQALSESNNEYKLEAHRDVGIRPLIAQLQNHVNQKLLPLIDPDLAKKASVKFVGLDVDTAEKESARLQQDMAVHMVYDEVLDKVEKKAIGKRFGGQFPLNPQVQQVIQNYLTFGEIQEEFFEVKGASQDPAKQFYQNEMWFNWQQLQQASQQAQQQQQADQQAQAQQQQQQDQEGDTDLSRSADQLIAALSKSESKLPPGKRRLLQHQRKTIAQTLEAFEAESGEAIAKIVADTAKLIPQSQRA
jgi:hypothetical protein